MDSESDSSAAGKARPPGRKTSRRQALPRRFTKGPLGSAAEEDPLSASVASVDDADSSQPTEEDAATPETKPSPPQFTTSPVPEPAISIVERPSKNFSFLLKPTNFLPINPQDVPPPFRAEHPSPPDTPLSSLLASGQFLSAATLSASTLQSLPDPTARTVIFPLLHIRLATLQLLGLDTQAAHESKALQDLNGPFYRDVPTPDEPFGAHLAPWDLRVLVVRLQAIGLGDWRRGIMVYYELAREARHEVKKASSAGVRGMWAARLQDLGVRVGNALVEIGDLDGAVRHLKTLPVPEGQDGDVRHLKTLPVPEGHDGDANLLRSRLCLAFLQAGDIEAAQGCVRGMAGTEENDEATAANSRMLEALCTMAEGKFADAIPQWQALHDSTPSAADRTVAAQNLAICCLYTGDVVKARNILEGLVDAGSAPGGVTFNLATIYELCSDRSRDVKLRLAEKIADMEASDVGWDRMNADFKL